MYYAAIVLFGIAGALSPSYILKEEVHMFVALEKKSKMFLALA